MKVYFNQVKKSEYHSSSMAVFFKFYRNIYEFSFKTYKLIKMTNTNESLNSNINNFSFMFKKI